MSERISNAVKIRILSVDDHPALREGIAAIVNGQPDMQIVAHAATGQGGIRQFREHRPDITLMDVRLPDISGIDALTAIRSEFPDAQVIMLSTFQGDVEITRSLAAGARGYLLKTMPPDEMLEVIRVVRSGKKCIPTAVAAELAEHLTGSFLTNREIEILQYIAAGNANREIGQKLFITEQTVKAHVRHIMEKLEARDRTQAVAIAVRRGILQI
jgi:DNA-binding NarL/FixJ family response regulator